VIEIRPERPVDLAPARRVHELAFGEGSWEGALVEALRDGGHTLPELCMVAVDGDEVVGHIVHSRVRLEAGHEALALAPMAVVPERQRAGIGSRLVSVSVAVAAATDFPLVVVVGHPAYYPRFGFEPAADLGLRDPWGVPPDAWMAYRLPAHTPEARGLVTYPPPFAAVT
jgi:putative acetyltransferase